MLKPLKLAIANGTIGQNHSPESQKSGRSRKISYFCSNSLTAEEKCRKREEAGGFNEWIMKHRYPVCGEWHCKGVKINI